MDQQNIDILKKMRVMDYGMTLTLPGTPGESVTGSVVITRSDFALLSIQHCVVGDDGTDEEQYSIDFSLQNTERFYKSPNAPMAKFFGSVRHGIWRKFMPPIKINETETVYVKITNRYAAAGDDRQIDVMLLGDEKRRSE